MKDFRNIRRSFLFVKALRKTNKMVKVEANEIYFLYVVWLIGGQHTPVKVLEVWKVLVKNSRTTQYGNVWNSLADLSKRGYLIKELTDLQVSTFMLTVEGLNLLSTFDYTLRQQRWNLDK